MKLLEGVAMPINFHSKDNRHSYAGREVDRSWLEAMQALTNVQGKDFLDIGCGGGIYSKAMARMGAKSVIGVDFSKEMLAAAASYCKDFPQIKFVQGTDCATGLPGSVADVVLERAVIHHIRDLVPGFREANRVLKSNGLLLIQDRTPEDCLLPGSSEHIRGYFFDRYPELASNERARRHDHSAVSHALEQANFNLVHQITLWETRKTYADADELSIDLLSRTGRSILHELSDEELNDLVQYIREQLPLNRNGVPIVEQDRWTVWVGQK
jgi:ubiquinone/menaquinone biosynthesis C-methylase UbiE